ncbi:unnamed protein product [Peniophora sp. CBMAI 1063]|nr:unnamed protein product [Peniophora sp. CBMAI 1063]
MPPVAQSLPGYAPEDFVRVLRGLPVSSPVNGAINGHATESVNYRNFAMSHYILAALDQHSADWTDYTSASSPYLPQSPPSSLSMSAPDAHVPGYILDRPQAFPDERIEAAVRSALPTVADVCSRPSDGLPEMGVWVCPQCGRGIDPLDLNVDERALIGEYLGVGDDCGVVERDDGRVELDRMNPWQYMRLVDCLAWDHFASHLRQECIVFWFPSPVTAYNSKPAMWWDENRLRHRQVYRPLRLEIEALERTGQYQLRMWKAKKMLRVAKQGIHAARYHLTRWRREAVSAREALVRQMFEAGRSIVDTGLAVVDLMDAEQEDPERVQWQESRDAHRAVRREWETRKEEWASEYLGP